MSMDESTALEMTGPFEARYRTFLATITAIRPSLHRYCTRMTGSILDGEDVVQEALVQAYRKLDAFDESRLRAALTVHERRRVRRDSTLAMDGDDWETDLHFLAGRLVTVSRCMVDPEEPPYIEHEKKRHLLHRVDPIKNASRPRSPSSHDAPHPARVAFDPARTMLDQQLGRTPRSRGRSEGDQ